MPAKQSVTALGLIVLMASVAVAQQSVIGLGASSCLFWTGQRNAKASFSWEQWLLGYVSGAGAPEIPLLKDPDGEAVLAWIDEYCRSHPLDQLGVAGHAYVVAHSH
jgi:hypothetical protein